jgi:hypothetical protein
MPEPVVLQQTSGPPFLQGVVAEELSMIRTEEAWRSCTNPDELLRLLVELDGISSRQARLFACACARHIWSMLSDERSRQAVIVAERYADGLIGDAELFEAFESAHTAEYSGERKRGVPPAFSAAAACAATEHEYTEDKYYPLECYPYAARPLQLALAGAKCAAERTRHALCHAAVGPPAHPEGPYSTEQSQTLEVHRSAAASLQCQLLRDIAGNPFRPVLIEPAWLTWRDGLVQRLARRIYDERASDLYPILADALEDAGCADSTILDHCRQPEGHARGCWVISRLLQLERQPQTGPAFVSHAERTWLLAQDPRPMLKELFDRPWSKRKVRLFMVACCRALAFFLTEERLRQAIDVAERFADGLASAKKLQRTFEAVDPPEALIGEDLFRFNVTAMVAAALAPDPDQGDIRSCRVWDWLHHAESVVGAHAFCEPGGAGDPEEAEQRSFAVQANLLRDILGNPLRPVTVDRHWLGAEIVERAERIYQERAFDRLPALADALEQGGCTNADLLVHLRSPGPHARGCWAVDLVLARE